MKECSDKDSKTNDCRGIARLNCFNGKTEKTEKRLYLIVLLILLGVLTLSIIYATNGACPRVYQQHLVIGSKSDPIDPNQAIDFQRQKRATNEILRDHFDENKNMVVKRHSENENIENLLVRKYEDINGGIKAREDFSDEVQTFIQKRSNDLKNSIKKLELTISRNDDLVRTLVELNAESEETADLIAKDLDDVEAEIRSLDDDIIGILHMTDNSIQKRMRIKRDTNLVGIDPVALQLYMPALEEKKREKRLVQEKLAEVRNEFIRCKKSATGENSSNCDQIYHSVIGKFREITKMFKEIEMIIDEMEKFDQTRSAEDKADDESEESSKGKKKIEKKKKKENKKDKKKDEKKSSEESKESSEEQIKKKSTMKPITTTGTASGEAIDSTTALDDQTTTEETTTTETTDEPLIEADSSENEIRSRPRSRKPMESFALPVVSEITQPDIFIDDAKTTTISLKLTNHATEKSTTFCPAGAFSNPVLGHPKFEEDLDDIHHNVDHITLDDIVSRKIQREQRDPFGEPISKPISDFMENARALVEETKELIEEVLDTNVGDTTLVNTQKPQRTSSTVKDSEFLGASGPFIALCEQVAKGKQAQQIQPQPQAFENHNFAPIQVPLSAFANNAFHFPATGETMKGSSKFTATTNPGFNVMQYPVCFVNYPQYRSAQQYFYPGLMPMTQPAGYFIPTVGGGLRPVQIPITNHGYMQGQGGYRAANEETQQTYCAFLASDNANLPAHYSEVIEQPQAPASSFDFASDGKVNNSNDGQFVERDRHRDQAEGFNIPTQFDIIYASYPHQMFALNHTHNHCDSGKIPCFASNQCIKKSNWCDSIVDCLDASDETACSCKARLSESRICDGFVDCPMGSDELGCFGCAKFQLSCYSSIEEFEKGRRSPNLMCYSSVERCDGFNNCRNGKDETECSMIVNNVGVMQSYTTSHSQGILHHNFKGRWYPVCKNAFLWASDACKMENGELSMQPSVTVRAASLPGPFIQPNFNQQNQLIVTDPIFSDHCHIRNQFDDEDQVVYVKCPPMQCGVSKLFDGKNWDARNSGNFSRHRRDEEARIVGGNNAYPMEFPFIVVIYKDGHFHCGGSIFDENWIITAAHCTKNFQQHFYEVRAGILRRSSYSPSAQISKVIQVVSHPEYDRSTMRNDIAVMRVEKSFSFNRWVRPICLPGKGRSTSDDDWKFGPTAGTSCSTLGWGAIREKGPDPDELKVVDVPILSKCRHAQDQTVGSICAGETFGTRDACQGDSGGPLICKSVSNPDEWYLAGIVSHGEGCARANEPGVYTRVSMFLDWIKLTIKENLSQSFSPSLDCPGQVCVWGGGKCIARSQKCDGFVDCLGGEDEIECSIGWLDLLLGSNGTTSSEPPQNDPKIDPTKILENKGEVNKTVSKKDTHAESFHCTKISQVVNLRQRCDKIFDCEDGTDEVNCTCGDHLKLSHSKLICDGHMDCADRSDEMGCLNCNSTAFSCLHSRKCIDKSFYCDGHPDCLFKEDELECIALTDGHTVMLDVNGKPFNNNKGIVTQNIQSEWKIMCDDNGSFNQTEVGDEICQIIGFRSAKSSRVVDFSTTTHLDQNISSNEIDIRRNLLKSSDPIKREKCKALEVECEPHQSHSSAILPIEHEKTKKNSTLPTFVNQDDPKVIFVPINTTDQTHIVVEPAKKKIVPPKPGSSNSHLQDLNWPWSSEIFVNGDLVANGILVDKSWVLVDKTILANSFEPLHEKFVVALFGNSRSQLNIESPYQQLRKVDCLQNVNNSNVMLLHLQSPVIFNRYVAPSFIPLPNDTGNDTNCIAIAPDSTRITKSLSLKIANNCKDINNDQICYQQAGNMETMCEVDDSLRTAAIMCKKAKSGWYPKAFHRIKDFCDFSESVAVFLLNQHDEYEQIRKVIEHPCGKCEHHAIALKCDTHRCSLGKCLERHQLCDERIDCHDKSDEQPEICQKFPKDERSCSTSEFQCRNGNCIEKSMFCNHVNDCGDKSDEPSECTCFSYLVATSPDKICDGTRHCWDKTDEDPAYCGTNCLDSTSFKCGRSPFCIPLEMVCDKRADCPNEADEQYCHGVYNYDTINGYGEIMQRSFGIWHTKCFPKPSRPTQEELEDLCKKLGHTDASNVIGRAIISKPNAEDLVEFESFNATKVVPFTKFSAVKINDKFTVHLKTSKPLAKLVSWDDNDHDNCYRMEVKCT